MNWRPLFKRMMVGTPCLGIHTSLKANSTSVTSASFKAFTFSHLKEQLILTRVSRFLFLVLGQGPNKSLSSISTGHPLSNVSDGIFLVVSAFCRQHCIHIFKILSTSVAMLSQTYRSLIFANVFFNPIVSNLRVRFQVLFFGLKAQHVQKSYPRFF